MRIFLITLGVSIVTSIGLWNLGLAQRIWPEHPLLCTTLLSMACGITTQSLLTSEARQRESKQRE
jgi:hypothetical protein